jgi:hypothetical protein
VPWAPSPNGLIVLVTLPVSGALSVIGQARASIVTVVENSRFQGVEALKPAIFAFNGQFQYKEIC